MELKFEWNESKNKTNQKKHGISFEEVSSIFNDPLSISFDDPDHSIRENRYIIMGLSCQNRHLFVAYTDREEKIRLISVRPLTARERRYL